MSLTDVASELSKQIAKEQDRAIFNQLKDLLDRGLLVVEHRGFQIARDVETHQIRYVSDIRLTLKDKEYVEKIEKENKELKEKLEKLTEAYRSIQ